MRLTTSVRRAPLIRSFTCALILYALSSHSAHATTLTWTTTAGTGLNDGSGTWADGTGGTSGSPGWNDASGNATNWTNSNPDSPVIGAGSGAAGTISLGGVVAVGDMTFKAPGSSNYIVNDNATAANTITLPPSGSTVNVASGVAPTLRVNLTDTNLLVTPYGPKLVKNGLGTLTYNLGTTNTLVPNNTNIIAQNGTMILGDGTNGTQIMNNGTGTTITLAGAELRTNNGTQTASVSANAIVMNSGATQITNISGGNNLVPSTSFTRNVGATLLSKRSSNGSAGYLKAPSTGAGIIPWNTTNATVPGYIFIENFTSSGAIASNGSGSVDFGAGASGTSAVQFFSGYVTTGEANWSTTSTLAFQKDNGVLLADRDIRGLKVNASVDSQALDLNGHNLALEGGGLIFAEISSGLHDYEIKDSVGGGALHGGYDGTTGASVVGNTDDTRFVRDLIIYEGFGSAGGTGVIATPATLKISAVIADNTTSAVTAGGGPTALTKSGIGTLLLAGNNTYTGNNYFNDGLITISSNANLGAPSAGGSINFGSANGSPSYVSAGQVTLLATANVTLDNSGLNKRNITVADKGAAMAASSGNTLTIPGVISTLPGMSNAPVTFGVATIGAGTVNLTGNNIYTGTTTVAAGTLLVNGTNSGGGAYTVGPGGTLGGSGSIVTANNAGAAIFGGGKLSPGNSPGVLSMDLGTGTLDIRSAITPVNSQSMLFDLDTPATSDQVKLPNAASSLTIGNGLLAFDDFAFTPTANFGPGDYTLFDTNNTISGFFDVFVDLQGVVGGYNAELQMADNNHDVILHVTTPVPEPSTIVLLTVGGLGLLACRRS